MNQVIIEVKLSVDTKQRAGAIIQILQEMTSGTKDDTIGIKLHSNMEGHAAIIQASYRDRKDTD